MKKILFALLGFYTLNVQAQTADDVIQKYTQNMGGLDAFNKIISAKITATFSTQGYDFPLTVKIINGKGTRSDVDVQGQTVINSYYNGKGWKVNPMAGIESPTEMNATELSEAKNQSSMATQLMDYKARGHKVDLKGKETVEGVETYKIDLTNKDDGKVTSYFIATKDYTLIKSIVTREIQGENKEVEMWYSDLKEFGGVKFFMTRETKMEGQVIQSVHYETVELNVPIDPKEFDQ